MSAHDKVTDQRFLELIQGLDAIVWEADPRTWQFTFVSERAEDVLGYPVENWYEPGFWVSIIHPEDREKSANLCRTATDAGQDHEFEYRALAADGRIVWIRDLIRVVKDENGRVVNLRGLLVDITERKRAEKALERSLIFERAVRQVHEAYIHHKNTQKIIEAICAAALEMGHKMCWVGLAQPDYTVKPVAFKGVEAGYLNSIRVRWDDSPEGNGPVGRAIRLGKPVTIADTETDPTFEPWKEQARKCGYRSVFAVPLKHGGKNLGAIAVYSQYPYDYTAEDLRLLETLAQQASIAFERAQQSEELQRTLELLTFYLQNVPLGLIMWDPDYRILEWNPAAESIFGWKDSEVIGKTSTILSPADKGGCEGCNPSKDRETPTYCICANIHKDGREIICEWYNTPLKAPDGTPMGMVSMVRDITELRRAEEGQARLAAVLEASPDFVATLDPSGRMLYLNAAGRQMLGLGEQNESVLEISECHPPDQAEFCSNIAIPTAIREGIWQGETTLQNSDGHIFPVSLTLLAHRASDGTVEYLSAIARDLSAQKKYEAQLVFLAEHDTLTGLFNRHRFEHELALEFDNALRTGTRGAVLFLDLDNFKYVNDLLGHRAGDDILRGLAVVLRDQVQGKGILARLGGDEFAILLPGATPDQAKAVANRILKVVEDQNIIVDGQAITMTTSIGIAFYPEQGKMAEDLLANADLAMYRAKEEGRNRIRFFEPGEGQQAMIQSNLTWTALIRDAIKQGRFELFLQPILDLKTGQVSRYEVLLRLRRENGELAPPAAFLKVAERFGLIHEIDRWVARESIHLIAQQKPLLDLRLEVNLSGHSLSDASLLDLIKKELSLTGVDPGNLVFEITETAAVANVAEARRFINALKKIGCHFALDDFGVGFSSFNYLKHLPVEYLKIDGGFIHELHLNQVDQHLVKAMVEVARGLGKKTIAEFVDSPETLRLLAELGVDYAQGYLIGKPGKPEQVLRSGISSA